MKLTHNLTRIPTIIRFLMLGLLGTALSSTASEALVQTGRYTLAVMTPERGTQKPLTAIVTTTISRHIQTIGGALEELLQGTGYTLGRGEKAAAGILVDSILLNQPYPDIQREIGPMPLKTIIETVAGPAWHVSVSPLAREIVLSPAIQIDEHELSALVQKYADGPYTKKLQPYTSTHHFNQAENVSRETQLDPTIENSRLNHSEKIALASGNSSETSQGLNLDRDKNNKAHTNWDTHRPETRDSTRLDDRKVASAEVLHIAEDAPVSLNPVNDDPVSDGIHLSEGENLINALIRLRRALDYRRLIISVDSDDIDINTVSIDYEGLIQRQNIQQITEGFPNLYILEAADANGTALVLTDNERLVGQALQAFPVKSGTLQENAARLLDVLQWKLDKQNGWEALDYPIDIPYTIVISTQDPQHALGALLSDYPIQARLNPSTESVQFVNRNPTH